MKKLSVFLMLCVFSMGAQANTYIQRGGTITYVATGQGDFPADESFFIKVSTNFGACSAGSFIQIRKKDFGVNVIAYQVLFTTALAAHMSGATNVSVYNGIDNDCAKATWIAVEK